MTPAGIASIESSLGIALPGPVRQFLLHTDAIPSVLQEDFFTDAGALVSKNIGLRRDGYYHLPWLPSWIAIGSDPGDNVYYFDLSDPLAPVYFADHDHDDPADFEKLADSPGDFAGYLVKQGEDVAELQKTIPDWPRPDRR